MRNGLEAHDGAVKHQSVGLAMEIRIFLLAAMLMLRPALPIMQHPASEKLTRRRTRQLLAESCLPASVVW